MSRTVGYRIRGFGIRGSAFRQDELFVHAMKDGRGKVMQAGLRRPFFFQLSTTWRTFMLDGV